MTPSMKNQEKQKHPQPDVTLLTIKVHYIRKEFMEGVIQVNKNKINNKHNK